MIGYRLGNIGRLGIISNCDLVFAYIVDVVWLNEEENYVCYIGVCRIE